MGTDGTAEPSVFSTLAGAVGQFLGNLGGALPSLLSFFAILAGGAVLAFLGGRLIESIARNAALPDARAVGKSLRSFIAVVTLLLASDRLGFGDSFVGIFLLIAIGAVVLAFAIAFGLGAVSLAREAAENRVAKIRRNKRGGDDAEEK
ncbi:MAG TPA: hypothetical protein VMV44_03845 [Rectinemataceae bacterium]|nr:hypothetical protein [Rectinemataceae bacterium]